jgi:hypothetical protein
VKDRQEILSGIESNDPDVFFASLRAMLDDLGIDNRTLSDAQLEDAVRIFNDLFVSSDLEPDDRHEILYRFAKAGGLPWLAMLAHLRDSVAANPGQWSR